MAGPAARPTAETAMAMPFRVPSVLILEALFVIKIALHGKAKTPQKHFSVITVKRHPIWDLAVGSKTAKGVMK
jgi:hypothetical protein